MRIAVASLAALALLSIAAQARAIEVESVAGEPMSIDITNTSILNYHFDNRNDDLGKVGTLVDDNYGEWLDRLNVQVGWWRLRFGLRLDVATFMGATAPEDALPLAREKMLPPNASGQDETDAANKIRRELNTRFLDTIYPAKLWIDYTQPGLQVTLGDFYAQLGRGLVFSVRKVDELALDTTVRGAKVVFSREVGPIRLSATALAGQMNPLRVDEATGRRLHGHGSPLFFGFPEAKELTTFGYTGFGTPVTETAPARPSYFEDTVVAGRVEVGLPFMQVAANGSLLFRKDPYAKDYHLCANRNAKKTADYQSLIAYLRDTYGRFHNIEVKEPVLEGCDSLYPDLGASGFPARTRDEVRTFSGSINVPSIFKHGDLYLEVAGQQLRSGHLTGIDESGAETHVEDLSGYAIYGSANAYWGPLTVSLEGKHYRSFFPLNANIDRVTPGFSAEEFETVAFSQPPTVEPIYVEALGSPNVCMTGGRARADFRFTKGASVYAWAGRYVSYSESSSSNEKCETKPEDRTNTWDLAIGSDLEFEKGKSHSKAWVGARVMSHEIPTDRYAQLQGFTDVFYQEGYIRYDVVKHIGGPFSLQFQGNHRRRHEPQKPSSPWYEGENYTALQWSPHISAIVGYEYRIEPDPESDDTFVNHYVNGGVQWKSGSHEKVWQQLFDTVQVFVGQRRGAVRCVSGVCRQFPPFEGAKLEIVSRF
ncbi:MAG: hypothetical protein HUU21_32170 [Polyangiaceae bacterium]|nr:hypothetical protein [Polyangiaceae bacterium]